MVHRRCPAGSGGPAADGRTAAAAPQRLGTAATQPHRSEVPKHRSTLPVDRQPQPDVTPLGVGEEAPLAAAVEVQVAEDLDVAAAVLLDQVQAPLLDPFERLQAVGGLAETQRVQCQPAPAGAEDA